MTSEGYWVRFSTLPERSLNCLPHARQRNRREPWAVRSDRSVTASDPHAKHRILVHPLCAEALARALTEPTARPLQSCAECPSAWCGGGAARSAQGQLLF